jgi:hypothetical protein
MPFPYQLDEAATLIRASLRIGTTDNMLII